MQVAGLNASQSISDGSQTDELGLSKQTRTDQCLPSRSKLPGGGFVVVGYQGAQAVSGHATTIGSDVGSRNGILIDAIAGEVRMEDFTRPSLILYQQRCRQRRVEMANEADQHIGRQIHDRSEGELMRAIKRCRPKEARRVGLIKRSVQEVLVGCHAVETRQAIGELQVQSVHEGHHSQRI